MVQNVHNPSAVCWAAWLRRRSRELLGVTEGCRREQTDRRQCSPLLADWRWSYRGRRRQLRREQDSTGVYRDHFAPGFVLTSLALLLLSGLDACLTLQLLQRGAAEANPVMRALLQWDVLVFINVKILVTAMGLLILILHSHLVLFRRLKVERVVSGLVCLYLAVVAYEIVLHALLPA